MSKSRCQTKGHSLMLAYLIVILPIHATDAAFISGIPRVYGRSKILLENKPANSDYSDFASYGDNAEEIREAQLLTKEFYEEVRLREARKSLIDGDSENDLRIRPNSSRSSERTNTYFSPPSTDDTSPLLAFLSFLNPPPPPPSSAGLFSGRGQTAYSSGMSQRAEIQLLESSLKKQNTPSIIGWDGVYITRDPHQLKLEQMFKAAAGTLIVLSVTYLALELAGGLTVVFPWEEVDGFSNVLVVLGDGIGDAAWMVEESSALVGSMGQALVHSMEELVLF